MGFVAPVTTVSTSAARQLLPQHPAMAGGLRTTATVPPASYRPPPPHNNNNSSSSSCSSSSSTAASSFQRRNSLDPVWEDLDHYHCQQQLKQQQQLQLHYQQQQQQQLQAAAYDHAAYAHWTAATYGTSYMPPFQPLPYPHPHHQQQHQPLSQHQQQAQHYRNGRHPATSSSSSSQPHPSVDPSRIMVPPPPSYPLPSSAVNAPPPLPPGHLRGRRHSLPVIQQPHLVSTNPGSMAGYDPMHGTGIPASSSSSSLSASASSSSSSAYNLSSYNPSAYNSSGSCSCPANASGKGCPGGGGGCFNSMAPSAPSSSFSASSCMSIGACPESIPLTSMPAPTLHAVTNVTYQDDYHWERLALNSASSLPAPVPSSYQPASHFPPSTYYQEFGPVPVSGLTRISHGTIFMTNNPQSDRLAEFVSKMVFVIFWHGSEAFDKILHALKHRSRGSVGEIILEQANLGDSTAYQATPEFVMYTKFLLQTMQISCSTALLSLFYLHRLRPRVQHMFVPGTFASHAASSEKRKDGSSSSNSRRYQYRRDPKLEYRLFTISVILANKYLDDNSYSNKAWSDVTGLELRKINIMEQEFMKYVDYNLVVVRTEYSAWVNWLDMYIGSVMPTTSKPFSFEPIPTKSVSFRQRRGSLPVTPALYPKSTATINGYGDDNNDDRSYLPTPSSIRKTDVGRYPRRHSVNYTTVNQTWKDPYLRQPIQSNGTGSMDSADGFIATSSSGESPLAVQQQQQQQQHHQYHQQLSREPTAGPAASTVVPIDSYTAATTVTTAPRPRQPPPPPPPPPATLSSGRGSQ